ncbi:MAG: hypothetical protein HY867_19745 [Chloroflexi bacterium]|nr:hypothetical protein [Chloroflexota bacterium]
MLRSPNDLTPAHLRALFDGFNSPIAKLDCGKKCAPHNPNGKPFCCDICHAVPAAFKSEWTYFQATTDLWHPYRADDCPAPRVTEAGRAVRDADLPSGMLLLACLGPDRCQRDFRALSCRAFPFFPYVTSDYRFLGLACEWEFESTCWVISNLHAVTDEYRAEFLRAFDHLLATFDDVFENYAAHSERLRADYSSRRKRFPLLHRNGHAYLVSPRSERMQRADVASLPKFGFYKPGLRRPR